MSEERGRGRGGRGRGGRGGDRGGGRGGRGRGGHSQQPQKQQHDSSDEEDQQQEVQQQLTKMTVQEPVAKPAPIPSSAWSKPPASAGSWAKPPAGGWSQAPPGLSTPVQQQPSSPQQQAPPANTSTTSTTSTASSSSSKTIVTAGAERRGRREADIDVENLALRKNATARGGSAIKLAVNQFPLKFTTQKLYQYAVDFQPHIDNRATKWDILSSYRNDIGLFMYDGVGVLYSIKQNPTTTYKTSTGGIVELQFIKEITQADPSSIHFYNILFKRFMKDLGFSMIGRQYFNSSRIHRIQDYNLEVWPGFFTSVNHIAVGTSLLADVAHKIVRTQHLWDFIKQQRENRVHDNEISNKLAGSIIITKYNNKTYRVTHIDFKKSVKDTFESANGKISYLDYYRKQYPNYPIKDQTQPLIACDVKRRGALERLYIIPELSFLTGMSEEITSNRRTMMALSNHTTITPDERLNTLNEFVSSLRTNQKVANTVNEWGFSIGDALTVDGFKLQDPTTEQTMKVLQGKRWAILAGGKDIGAVADDFAPKFNKLSGMAVPDEYEIQGNPMRAEPWVSELTKLVGKGYTFVLCVIPQGRKEIYDAIKKVSLTRLTMITQCAVPATLSKPGTSVAVKITHQVIAKLGQSPWHLKGKAPYVIPKKTMVVGIDVGHNSDQKGKSVVGFVASINDDHTLFHTTAICQSKPGKEIVESLKPSMLSALSAYYKKNGCLPDVVIVYRDGVGDGMLGLVRKYEVAAIKDAFAEAPSMWGVKPKLLYSVVKKSTNTRFFDRGNKFANPEPGTIVDKTCTHNNWYDFYLVSQRAINKGSINPTHYHVIVDETDISAENFQSFTYHMCFMYYNFDKSVRVPSVTQYAHKLAFLIGRHVHASVESEELTLKLYFL